MLFQIAREYKDCSYIPYTDLIMIEINLWYNE